MKITHVLYSGLGGHGEYAFSLIGENELYNNSVIFFGVEVVKKDYINHCASKNITWKYVHKGKGFTWFLNLLRYYKLNHDNIYVIHSSIALLPFIFLRRNKKVIYVEHQSNKLKSKMDWFCSLASGYVADKRIFITSTSLEEVKAKLGLFFRNKGFEILQTGIDIHFWQNNPINKVTSSNTIKLGMQGRLVSIKNFSCLIKALPLLQGKFPSINFEVHIAGDGEDKEKLKKLVADLKLEQNVYFHGNLNRENLLQFMQNLSFYVHSTKGETLSTSILQAMALQIPIIASNVEGVSNLLTNDVEALLFSENDEYQLAHSVSNLLLNQEKQASLIKNSYQKILKQYTLDVMKKNFNKIVLHV